MSALERPVPGPTPHPTAVEAFLALTEMLALTARHVDEHGFLHGPRGEVYHVGPRREQAIIYDVDGTLCDVSSVRHHVLTRPKNFDAFHEGAVDCPPHRWVLDLAHFTQAAGFANIVVTARSTRWEHHTVLWLGEQGVPYDELFMRERFDQRPDYDIKRDIHADISRRYDVRAAIDDNPSVLKLWGEIGIPTITVPGWVEDPDPSSAGVHG